MSRVRPAPPNGRPPAAQASSPPTGTVSSSPAVTGGDRGRLIRVAGLKRLDWDSATNLLWIGERNGLVRFDPATDAFTHYGGGRPCQYLLLSALPRINRVRCGWGTQHGLYLF
ncbi:MAG: hypothetical protein R2932_44835 [Caldilineaceae bacterium]